ncbi:MAG: polymer-forming cytoskeletal protein, partial [Candidatus Shapirobacteria bacterium]
GNDTSIRATDMAGIALAGIKAQQLQITSLNQDLSLTSTGQISINYNISDEVLASLGYDGAKNEIESATYSLTDSTDTIVNRISQFSEIASAKIKAGLISATNIVTKNLIAEKINTKELISPKADIDQLTAIDIQTTSITTEKLTSTEIVADNATISGTLYANNIISPEGSIGDLMTSKINDLRDQLTQIVSAKVASESALLADSHDWSASVATDSAQISGDLALSNNLIVGAQLMVNGDSQLGNAFISGTFTAGEIAIKDNLIETTNTALYIQPSGSGSVHIMGDTLVIAENGDVQINGNLTVHGSLFASLLETDEIKTNKLTTNEIHIATDSAQLIIANSAPITEISTQTAQLNSNATAGTTNLPAGKTELIISTDKLNANSMVYLTPIGSTNNQVLYIKNKVFSGSESYFTISIDNPLTQDISINWWVIN